MPELVLVMKGHNDMIVVQQPDLFLGTRQEVKGMSIGGHVPGLHLVGCQLKVNRRAMRIWSQTSLSVRESEKVCHWPECWGLR